MSHFLNVPISSIRGPLLARSLKTSYHLPTDMTKPKTLISFDVDGTLIHSVGKDANKLHKEAFSAAFDRVFDIQTTIDVIPHHGSTDPLILVAVLQHHGISHSAAMDALPQMQQVMIDHFLEHREKASTGLEVLPGVVDLLTALQAREDTAVCLVTGNLEPIAWAKMQSLKIDHLFTAPCFGGFGSDYCSGNTDGMGWRDRSEFVKIAAKKCKDQFGEDLVARYHVGDAPMDIKAAEASGSTPIGVTTGIYTTKQLSEASLHGDCIILDGLSDVDKVMKLCNLV